MKTIRPFRKRDPNRRGGGVRQSRKRNKSRASISAIVSEYIFLAIATISFIVCVCPPSSFAVTVQAANSVDPPPPPPPPPRENLLNGKSGTGNGEYYRDEEDNFDRRRGGWRDDGERFYDTPQDRQRRFDDSDPSDDTGYSLPSTKSFASTAASSSSSSTAPIHYNFPTMDASSILQSSPSTYQNDDQDSSSPPKTSTHPLRPPPRDPSLPSYASPRTDLLTTYTSASPLNHLRIHLASASVGLLLGSFLGRSTVDHAQPAGYLTAATFALVSLTLGRGGSGNAYGEMVRTLGFAAILLWGRYRRDVRGVYGTGKHLRAALGTGARAPFPPAEAVENPWRYRPEVPDDPDFDMVKSLACVALLGSFCGGNLPVPLLPAWIGGSMGAVGFGSLSLMKSPAGDLMRTMGMRIVALVGEAVEVNGDLGTGRKVAVVCGRILDRTMVLDRKHRIREKVGGAIGRGYRGVVGVVGRIRDDRKFQTEEEERGSYSDKGRGSDIDRDRDRDRGKYRDMDMDRDRYRK